MPDRLLASYEPAWCDAGLGSPAVHVELDGVEPAAFARGMPPDPATDRVGVRGRADTAPQTGADRTHQKNRETLHGGVRRRALVGLRISRSTDCSLSERSGRGSRRRPGRIFAGDFWRMLVKDLTETLSELLGEIGELVEIVKDVRRVKKIMKKKAHGSPNRSSNCGPPSVSWRLV